MLLATSHPHDDLSVKVMGARIVLWPMDRPCHLSILTETAMDGRVAVCRRRVIRVVGDVGFCLALVGHGICHELGNRLPTMRR